MIRDQGYKLYKGDLTAGSHPIWIIAITSMALYWGKLRTKLLFIFLMVVPVIFILLTFAEHLLTQAFGQGGQDVVSGVYEYAFGYVELWMLAFMFAASGCGVVADDMRHRTIQLYFSKPIGRYDYMFGKFLSLVLLGSLVTVLPYLLVAGIRSLIFIPRETFQDVMINMGMLGLFNLTTLALFSAIVLALSCLTSRRGYVVLAWIGFMLVPSIVASIVAFVQKGAAWADLLSVTGALATALKVMVGFDKLPNQLQAVDLPAYMDWAPWIVIAAVFAASFGVVFWRTSKLEGIA